MWSRLSLIAVLFLPALSQESPMMGFSPDAARAQRELEVKFDQQMNPENLREWMTFMASKPHHVGSPQGLANAEFMRDQFTSWGFDTKIETYYVLFPVPRKRVLKMLSPVPYEALLAEPAIDEDPSSADTSGLPVYNAYSPDGNVTGELVYANRGLPEDYEELARRGIDVRGKIVIVRYYGSWRGIKPKVAAEHGAIGCIIFSDPGDDGYAAGDEYPKGGYRSEYSAQRGSIVDMPRYSGDPLTPGYAATREARRLDRKDAITLPTIPTLPISWHDALPLLKSLEGPVAPQAWRGGLPIPYHMGPGPAKVNLELTFDWQLAPAHNVIARLPGSEFPDQWIIRGNHHDAWVFGATDPVSGMVSLMEEARAIGQLVKTGWRPKRTMIYAAWDAEEPGLMGSVEWAEDHADELRQKAVVYLNSDSNERGPISMGGSHTLETFVNQVASELKDPITGDSVIHRARSYFITEVPSQREQILAHPGIPLSPLGSGSDWTGFLQHLGIAGLNVDYGGEGEYGQYHSNYDSIYHYQHFMDGSYQYGILEARTTGRIMLRMANAEVLPFDTAPLVSTVSTYVEELVQLADDLRHEAEVRQDWLEKGYYKAAAHPEKGPAPPKNLDAVPFINFAPLLNARLRLQQENEKFIRASEGKQLSAEKRVALNEIFQKLESALTTAEGLPGRPWFTHQIYAPGFYTGYGVKTLPAVREALELRNWQMAAEQIEVMAGVFDRFRMQIEKARNLYL